MNIKTEVVFETEKLDSEGTYKEIYLVETVDGSDFDMKELKEEADDRFMYRPRCAGQYFCSRVDVWSHPYLKNRAMIEVVHQLDI